MKNHLILLLSFFLMMIACDDAEENIENINWVIIEIQDTPIHLEKEAYLLFYQGRMNGFAGCNRIFSDISMKGDHLSFDDIGSTRMFCEDDTTEQAILELLGMVEEFDVEDHELLLMKDDEVLMKLVDQKTRK